MMRKRGNTLLAITTAAALVVPCLNAFASQTVVDDPLSVLSPDSAVEQTTEMNRSNLESVAESFFSSVSEAAGNSDSTSDVAADSAAGASSELDAAAGEAEGASSELDAAAGEAAEASSGLDAAAEASSGPDAEADSAIGSSDSGNLTVQEICRKTMPAMVSITNTTVEEVQSYYSGNYDDFFDDFFFGYGFGGFGRYGGSDGGRDGGQTETRESISMGSGIIVAMTDDAIIIATNEHVIDGATTISVGFIDDTAAEAEVLGEDRTRDLAVIQVPKGSVQKDTLEAITVITFGKSSELEVGEGVVAIGNALGYGQSVSAGIVSALNRSISSRNETTGMVETTDGMIQTDASINPGNSGGALLNMRGELIGINSAKFADTMVEGMGYAIPIDAAEPILTDLANGKQTDMTGALFNEDGSVRLGVTVLTITEELAEEYSLPYGVYVATVENGGAADAAGLKAGDIIVAIDGTELLTVEALKAALLDYSAGDFAVLKVLREADSPFGNEPAFVEGEITVRFGEGENPDSSRITM